MEDQEVPRVEEMNVMMKKMVNRMIRQLLAPAMEDQEVPRVEEMNMMKTMVAPPLRDGGPE